MAALDNYYTFYISKQGPFTWDQLANHLSANLTGAQLKAQNEYADDVTSLFNKTPVRILKQYLRPEIAATGGFTTDQVSYANPINYTIIMQDIRDQIPEILKPGAPESALSAPASSRVKVKPETISAFLSSFYSKTHSGAPAPASLVNSGMSFTVAPLPAVGSSLIPANTGSTPLTNVIDSTATVIPDAAEKMPAWVWVAGGVGLVLLFVYMRRK